MDARKKPISLAALLLGLALTACPKSPEPPPSAPAQPPPTAPTPTQQPAQPLEQEACVDNWLTAHKLDRFGNPDGTMYAGGTPLFDEQTGTQRDRLSYVFEKQPQARLSCPGGAALPPPQPGSKLPER